jgi:hypothetical protein
LTGWTCWLRIRPRNVLARNRLQKFIFEGKFHNFSASQKLWLLIVCLLCFFCVPVTFYLLGTKLGTLKNLNLDLVS